MPDKAPCPQSKVKPKLPGSGDPKKKTLMAGISKKHVIGLRQAYEMYDPEGTVGYIDVESMLKSEKCSAEVCVAA